MAVAVAVAIAVAVAVAVAVAAVVAVAVAVVVVFARAVAVAVARNGVFTMSAIDALERDAKRLIDGLRIEQRKLADQLRDAMDEIYALRLTIRERDELIAEMQQINTSRRTGR